MFEKRLLKIGRDASYNFNKSKFLRLDANERVIPFSNQELSAIKKEILASDTASHANNKLLEAAINAPKKSAFIVPNLKAKKPPTKPPSIVANTPKNLE